MIKRKENDTVTIHMKSGTKIHLFPATKLDFEMIWQAQIAWKRFYILNGCKWIDRKEVEAVTWQNGEAY